MLNFFTKKQYGTGAVNDPRTKAERDKDFRAEEVLALGAVQWREKPESEWKKYPIFDQAQSGSCVAMSKAKEAGILNFLEEGVFMHLSPRDVYTQRKNKPDAGMWGQDSNKIVRDKGITLETLMPSMNKGEEEMNVDSDRRNSTKAIAKVFRAKVWLALPFNFDAIARVLDTGRGVNLFFRFDMNEWDRPVPVISPTSRLSLHHAVVATERTLYKGQRALIIEDSWGRNRGINGRRIITEDWRNRLTWVSYFEDLSNLDLLKKEDIPKPRHTFTRDLSVGMTNDPDVKALQDILKFEGLFPRTQVSTGNFFGITRKAVIAFQEKYAKEILTPANLSAGTGIVGRLTRAFLNKKYGA